MRKIASLAAAALALAGCEKRRQEPAGTTAAEPAPKPATSIILATTTSTQDSGLLDVLVPKFKSLTGIDVKVIAVGTGAALKMAEKGDADVVLSHAPPAEAKLADAGHITDGRLIMHNDYVIVGPAADPAGLGGTTDLAAAMKKLAEAGGFASRGDDSGTHKKELELWKAAGVDPASVARREETGQGMGATLNVADQKGLYTLTDRGTYLSLKKRLALVVLFEGAAPLLNVYQAYVVNPEKHPKVKADAGRAFLDFLVSPETQATIGEFKKADFGEPLFVPDAGKSREALGL